MSSSDERADTMAEELMEVVSLIQKYTLAPSSPSTPPKPDTWPVQQLKTSVFRFLRVFNKFRLNYDLIKLLQEEIETPEDLEKLTELALSKDLDRISRYLQILTDELKTFNDRFH